MASFHVARLETRHFTFVAYGLDEKGAREAMAGGLRVHCKEYRLNFEEFMREFGESIEVRLAVTGRAYRDGERLETK